SSMSISSNLSGTTATTATGPGTMTLSGDNSAMTGGLSVAAGAVVEFTTPNNLGSGGAVTLNTGTLRTLASQAPDTHDIRVTGGGTIDTNGFDSTFAGAFTQNGGLTKAGAGTLVLTSTANTYAGNTTVNAGTLQIPFGASIGAGSIVNNA